MKEFWMSSSTDHAESESAKSAVRLVNLSNNLILIRYSYYLKDKDFKSRHTIGS